jgi:hypothetical protein
MKNKTESKELLSDLEAFRKTSQTELEYIKNILNDRISTLESVNYCLMTLINKLNSLIESEKQEFTFTDISLSLNNYVDEYIDNYSPRTFDSDELGEIDYDKENNSINVYFNVDSHKVQEIIRDQIESFIHNWYNIAQQERKSSTEEV